MSADCSRVSKRRQKVHWNGPVASGNCHILPYSATIHPSRGRRSGWDEWRELRDEQGLGLDSWLAASKPGNQCHLTMQAGVWTQWHRCVGGTSWTGCRRSVKTSGPLGRQCVKPHLALFYLYGNEILMSCQGRSCHGIKPVVANWIRIRPIVKTKRNCRQV